MPFKIRVTAKHQMSEEKTTVGQTGKIALDRLVETLDSDDYSVLKTHAHNCVR